MINQWGDPLVQGDELAKAEPSPAGPEGNYIPTMNFRGAAPARMDAWSRKFRYAGENLAAVLDGKVISIAPLEKGAIISEQCEIRGTFKTDYVKQLCDLLNSGALPVDLQMVRSERLDPTTGAFAFDQLWKAGLIAFAVISVFLVGYYGFPGFVAFLALMLYMLFTLAALKSGLWIASPATFSLASIAGFVLSVGMAVDANILVFERFREEMKSGKELGRALDLGFRRALPAIFDSNACTIITSTVLAMFNTGPVQGFAVTLIIGVAISLFTAVTVTRSLLFFFVGSGLVTNPKWFAVDRQWFRKSFEPGAEPLRVVEQAKKWFWLSGLTILVGVPFAFIGGFKTNVEFRGGTEIQYKVSNDVNLNTIGKNLAAAGFRDPNLRLGSVDQKGQATKQGLLYVTLEDSPLLKDADGKPKSDADIEAMVAKDGGFQGTVSDLSQVSGEVQKDSINTAIWSVCVSSLLIVIYLAFRFGLSVGGFWQGARFAVAAIGALVHDILVVFFTAAIVGFFMHWEISQLFITAMLTIIGFSVHDTIVIFDRMRENLRRANNTEEFGHLMDRSITQSFARSINTSMTVIVTLIILVAFGTATADLKFFCVAMLVGIVSGTYSSIYNASPILYLWDKWLVARKGPQVGLMGLAFAEHARNRIVAPNLATSTLQGANPANPANPAAPGGQRSYGQVKRRANQAQQSQRNLDDDEP
jgi:SecD/SecF fusion protein